MGARWAGIEPHPPASAPTPSPFPVHAEQCTGKEKAVINFLRQPLADTYHTLVVGFHETTGQVKSKI